MNSTTELETFITQHAASVAPLAREAALASWEMQTTGSEKAQSQAAELSAKIAKIYANPQEYAFLRDTAPDAENSRLARQHILLRNAYLEHQMDESVIEQMIALEFNIENTFNGFRATVGGREVSDNEIDDLLIESNDVVLRREAWEASKTVGAAVADRVLELVRIRNREAQRLGFPNYYAMHLQLQELDEERLFTLLDDLKVQTDPLWRTYKTHLDSRLAARFGEPTTAIRPWHHASRFFQEPGPSQADLDRFFADKNVEALAAQFFAAIDLPIADLLPRADLYERSGKCQHAFCMDVDRQGDVRVLCNCRSNERWMGTLLHEFGHAVYDKFNDPGLPFLLREPAHTLTTEAIALFMGRLTKDANWLHHWAGVPAEEAERIAGEAQQEMRDYLLVFLRWCLVMTSFERAMYRNPEQDLNALWWELVERFQNVTRPEGRNAPDWAAKIHLATTPVYYQNYQLGEMVASQLLHHIQTVVLTGEPPHALVTSPKVGAYMRERLFAPGATRPWEDWLAAATGERLNPSFFVRQLQSG